IRPVPRERSHGAPLEVLRKLRSCLVYGKRAQRLGQRFGAGVAIRESTVAETRYALPGRELALQPSVDVTARLHLVQHAEYQTRRRTVERTRESAVGSKHRRAQ